MGIQMIVISMSALALVGIVNREGVETAAAFGVAMQLWTYVQMPAMALGAAVSAMTAQNIGAGLWERVNPITRSGIIYTLLITGLLIVALTLSDRSVLALFMGPDSPALPIARHIHVLATWNFLLFGVTMVLFGTVRANGARLGAADHPVRRPGADPVRLHLRQLSGPERRRDLAQFSGELARQPCPGNRILPARRLAEGADGSPAERRRVHRGSGSHPRARRRAQPGRLKPPTLPVLGGGSRKSGYRYRRAMSASYPALRMRRGRSSPWMRSMLAEHRLHPSDFILPLFVCDGSGCEEPIGSLPGVSRWSVDRIAERAKEAAELGIPCVALFPNTPNDLRTDDAREALNPDNLICRAIEGDQGRGAGDRRADRRRARPLYRARP